MRIALVLVLLSITAGAIAAIFWQQELKYVLPTPVPKNYSPVAVKERIDLSGAGIQKDGKPIYLHFFNPDCPCSRFNLKHFNSLRARFERQVKIYAVIPALADTTYAGELIGDPSVSIIYDDGDLLAEKCGVYATPQAVMIDGQGHLFYRGNYNKSRYCTTKDSNYAELALTALANGEEAPAFDIMATRAYGCELPENTDSF